MLLRVLRGLFTGSPQVSHSLDDAVRALHTAVVSCRNEIDDLKDAVERQRVALNTFRGRVYAWKGAELPPDPSEKAQDRPLNDPALTKAELRARLLKPGKPFKHN